jgi:hypothetical protein
MKKIFLTGIFTCAMLNVMAQTETYDLTSFTPPKGWTKDANETVLAYTSINKTNNTWCRINIVKSTTSKGSIEADFESEWNNLVVVPYKVTDPPQENEIVESDGWKVKSAAGKFTFNDAGSIVLIATASGFERCVSIVSTTNSQDYITAIQSFIESVKLIKPGPAKTTPAVPQDNAAISDPASVIGIWGKTSNNNSNYEMNNGLHGYFSCQYTFNKNGTYSFISRIFNYLPDILLAKENGTYKVTGNTVTLTPQNSIIQKWTKGTITDNTGKPATVDKLGKLVSSQKRTLEKTSYRFTKEYFSGINEWSLQLSSGKETLRDGPFNGGNSFPNTWFYKAVVSDIFLVKTD